jgi:hypothetical protein
MAVVKSQTAHARSIRRWGPEKWQVRVILSIGERGMLVGRRQPKTLFVYFPHMILNSWSWHEHLLKMSFTDIFFKIFAILVRTLLIPKLFTTQ